MGRPKRKGQHARLRYITHGVRPLPFPERESRMNEERHYVGDDPSECLICECTTQITVVPFLALTHDLQARALEAMGRDIEPEPTTLDELFGAETLNLETDESHQLAFDMKLDIIDVGLCPKHLPSSLSN